MIAITRSGIRYFRFSLFEAVRGLSHVVTSRLGGVSSGPYASLNLALHVGDDAERVEENRRRVLSILRSPCRSLVGLHQSHEGKIHRVSVSELTSGNPEELTGGADCLWTRELDLPLAVFGADCPLVLLYHPAGVIAVVHASWRCSVRSLSARTVDSISKELHLDRTLWLAGISPSIGPCCYEVGEDVLEEAKRRRGDTSSFREERGTLYFDLWQENISQLISAGLARERIELANLCTSCHTDLFYSYRREGPRTGRFALIACLVSEI